MGKINILNNAGDAKASLEFNGSSDITVNADNLSGITSDVQGQIDSKVDKISSTDNAIARFDGSTGQLQDSGVTVDDSGTLYMPDNAPIRWGTTGELVLRRTESNNIIRLGSGVPSDEIQFYAGAAERLRIDSAGRVTMPHQPAFSARFNVSTPTAQVGVTSRTLIFDEVNINIGNHYNATTGAFTAPISGLYKFYTSRALNTLGPDQNIRHPSLAFNKNGVIYSGINTGVCSSSGLGSGDYMHFSVSFEESIYLNAGDYVDVVFNYSNSPSVLIEYASNYFSGQLIG